MKTPQQIKNEVEKEKIIPKNWKEVEKMSKKPIKDIIDNYMNCRIKKLKEGRVNKDLTWAEWMTNIDRIEELELFRRTFSK